MKNTTRKWLLGLSLLVGLLAFAGCDSGQDAEPQSTGSSQADAVAAAADDARTDAGKNADQGDSHPSGADEADKQADAGRDQAAAPGTPDLEIRRISPSGDDVEPGRQVVIQFDRTMVALGDMRADAADLDVRIAPDPGCEWRWLDTSELACRLDKDTRMAPATQYTVTVGTGLRSHQGSHLAEPVSETFTTELPKIEYVAFDHWAGPAEPVLRVELNVPVTAEALAGQLSFTGAWDQWPVRVEPYTKKRQSPLFLPVPGHPGAVLVVEDPKPDTPLDADKDAAEARNVWQLRPDGALPSDKGTNYSLWLDAGLHTPLGPLPGQGGNAYDGHLFGDFAFAGLQCGTRERDSIYIRPGPRRADADGSGHQTAEISPARADSMDELETQDCRPGSVQVLFSAPVPRATLEQLQWQSWQAEGASGAGHAWSRDDRMDSTSSYAAEDGSRYTLPFALAARDLYTLTIPADVEDVFGRKLGEPIELRFATAHRAPFLQTPPRTGVLEPGQPTIMALRHTNLEQLRLEYQTLTVDGLAQGHRSAHRSQDLLAGLDGKDSQDEIITGKLGLRELLDGRSGVLLGKLDWAPDGPRHPYELTGQVTPWNVFAKVGYYGTLVWVTRLDDGTPVAGAEVNLYRSRDLHEHDLTPLQDRSGQPMRARTSSQGVALLPSIDPDGRDTFYVGVVQDDDMALLPLDWSFSRSIYEASHGALWQDNASRGQRRRFWAVTSQGIYKPGSDIKYAAFVRVEGETRLEPSDLGGRAIVTITDPEGNAIVDGEGHDVDAWGGLHGELHIPESAPMGWYDIQVGWIENEQEQLRQAGRFLVTDFVPASFEVQTDLQGERLDLGDEVRARITARLHAGGPYTDAPATFKTRLIPRRFEPDNPATAGFTFDDDADWPDAQTLSEDETRLDAQGQAENMLTLPDESDIIYGELRVEGVVASSRGKSVANSAALPFAARDRFIGLRTDDWVQTAGQPFEVAFVVTDVAGQLQKKEAVTLTLEIQDVSRVREKDADGDYVEQEETRWIAQDRCTARSAAAPAHCELTPDKPGRYRVVGQVKDSQGRSQRSVLDTYVAGAGRAIWSHDDKVLTLVPDASEYHVGDTAHVLVQNPYPGARALLTVERYGVLWQRVVTLEGSAPVVDIPIEKAAFPGAFLSVTLFSPRVSPAADPDLGKPVIAQGYMPLKVTGRGGTLDVAVQPDSEETRPGSTVGVDVQVRDVDGNNAGATRLVALAMDQAVLDLLREGKNYYDPRATFYAPPESPDMRNYSLVEQLLSTLQAKAGKGESPSGGGGDAGPRIRDNFSYSAFWDAELETNADGRAHFDVELPDNLTRWRIFVIAMSKGDPMGLGDASVRANLPLQVQPALPNQVRVGDRFEAGFEVTNRTQGELQDIATQVNAEGALEGDSAQTNGRFNLPSFGHGLVWLPLNATGPGTINLNATTQAGALSDGVQHSIPVHHAGSTVTAAEQGSLTEGSAEVPLQVPEDAVPDAAHAEVVLAPTILGGLDAAFEVMRDDPLRNWETRLSRAVLAADYLQLQDVLGDAVHWPDAQQVVDDELQAASDFQASNGGMAFWSPRNEFVSRYLSVYTALAVGWLADAGHAVPASVAGKLRQYLQHDILGSSDDDEDGDASTILRAGALAALAQWPGAEVDAGEVADLLPRLPALHLFGKALLLNAAIAVDDRDSADAVAKALLSSAEESSGEISFNETRSDGYASLLDTPLRSNCAILDALARYKQQYGDDNLLGEVPQKLMRWVADQRAADGSWPNSQENVFCTTATARYASVYEAPVTDLGGSLQLPQQDAQQAHFGSRQDAAATLTGPTLAPGSALSAAVTHTGSGRLYYNLRLHYVMPPDALPAANAGMTVQRSYHVQRDGQWQPVDDDTELKRGDIVRVDLDVDTPTQRHQVVLTDPLPGAFEAVNRELATAEQALPAEESDGRALLMFDGGAWPNMSVTTGGFYHREMAFDAVRFHADSLPAGSYRLVYSAQVVAPGRFTAPAPLIKEIYHPDVFGRGEAQHLKVGREAP